MLAATAILGSTTPRIWTPPLVTGPPGPCGCGCALTPKTSLGFSAVDFAHDVVGIRLLPWQRWLMVHALELRPDGRFRFRTVLVLVSRQNGKTSVVEVKNLFKLFVLRVPLVIGTAQNLDISEESWDKAVEIVESVPELAAEVEHVDRTNGKKALRLTNGSRWKIAAASRKGGRGLSGDDVNLDELREHQNWDSWGAVTKTTMARANAQIWAFSNAGDDKSVVLNDLQAKGRAAAAKPETADPSLGLFEWSAPDDVRCTCAERGDGDPHEPDCPLQDRRVWAQANPSLGYTVTEEALESALSTDPEAIFLTECLCQRVPNLVDNRVISEELWLELADPRSQRPADVAFAIVVNPQRTHTSILAVGPRSDGKMVASVVDYRPGTAWVPARAAELKDKHKPVAFFLDTKGPGGSLLMDLERVGITAPKDPERPVRGDLAVPTAQQVAVGYGLIVDLARNKGLVHFDEAPLNVAVAAGKPRSLAGGSAWDSKGDVDISPLVGMTGAHWAYVTRIDAVNRPYDALNNIW